MIRNELEFFNRLDRIVGDIETIAGFIRVKSEQDKNEENKLLTKAEVADILGVSERSVDRYRENEGLVAVVIGGLVSFLKGDVWDFIQSHRRKFSRITRDDFEMNYKKFVTNKRKSTWKK